MLELLSPAGSYEKMLFAYNYGADAVYAGAKSFSLREGAVNFTIDELKNSISYSHKINKKIYLATNIFFHDEDIEPFKEFLEIINELRPDGIIMSDIGLINFVLKKYPNLNIHISTQANTVNSITAKYYEDIGVKRIILARELSIDEIKKIRDNVKIELECFVHGAVCMSYSGRCLLSNYFTNPNIINHDNIPLSMKKIKNRDANRGDCAQPCRWNYYLMEENRKGEYFPIIEEEKGTAILSSKDLNMAKYIKELISAGIDSFKIEGRMKSAYYTAVTARVYRKALDYAIEGKILDDIYLNDLDTISHREYFTGFFFSTDRKKLLNIQTTTKNYIKDYTFLAFVLEKSGNNRYLCRAMNRILKSDGIILYMTPDFSDGIINDFKLFLNDEETDVIQPNMEFILETDINLNKYDILRRK